MNKKIKIHPLYQTRFLDGVVYLVPRTENWGNWQDADAVRYHGVSHPTVMSGAQFDQLLDDCGAADYEDVHRIAFCLECEDYYEGAVDEMWQCKEGWGEKIKTALRNARA